MVDDGEGTWGQLEVRRMLVRKRASAGWQASKPSSNFGEMAFFFFFFTKHRQLHTLLNGSPGFQCRGCFRAARRGDMAHGWAPDLENPFRVT